MHTEILNTPTKRVLESLIAKKALGGFYLAGGTALALHVGHRKSIDLDWFSESVFSSSALKNTLSAVGALEILDESEGTLNGILDEVKISFFHYPYPLLFPLVPYEGHVQLADERDIGCMKIDAISSRGDKKDFIDIYVLLQRYELTELFSYFEKKYARIRYNRLHLLKSMTFFEDADAQPMPDMLEAISWEKVKEDISRKVKKYLDASVS